MLSKIQDRLKLMADRSKMAVLMTLVVSMSNVGVEPSRAATINTSPVGSGFTVSAADLAYILKQIKIAEYHVANTTSATGLCGALLGTGPNQINSPLLSFGLRTVDGSCNNLELGQAKFGAADQVFPRLTTPMFMSAEDASAFGGSSNSSYTQTSGSVADTRPRMISNLIVDQTSTNPAAIEVAGFPYRTQGNEGVVPCLVDPTESDPNGFPDGCVPSYQTLFIPNVTTDVGLSPPFNSLFTIFGQFFDHGLDKINNGDNGTVFVPLKDDDPLIAGPDHIAGNSDDLPLDRRFMALSRGTIVPPNCSDNTNPNCFRGALNSDSPFVDQSQTYSSHSSHQVFLREYKLVDNKPVATGKFLSEPEPVGGIAKWATVKEQAAAKLGLQLVDMDVNNIPEILADPYGNFIPGPDRGLPQYVTAAGLVEGDINSPVPAPENIVRINTAFLNDIAHSAAPTAGGPDDDEVAGGGLDTPVPAGTYDNELLDQHFICGDGRCNENIALTAIHQIFHMEHDRLIDYNADVLALNPTLLADYQTVDLAPGPNKTFTYEERLFQAARFVTEMQYQHLVFEEFARKVQPAINPFEAFAFNQTDVNSAITAEFAHAVYRFGHSMLTETLPRPQVVPDTPAHNDIDLLDGFLNPAEFFNSGNPAIKLTSHQAAATLIMGMSDQVGNEIDEFVTDTLRNNLLGLPLDLPSLNMARARSEGVPSLNNVRKQIFAATNDGQLTPYANWVDFDQAIKHHASLVNFIAAYGKHGIIASLDPDGAGPIEPGSLKARRMAADQIVNATVLPGPDGTLGDIATTEDVDESLDDILPPDDIGDFMFSIGAWANDAGVSTTGVDDIDLWTGGLAELTNVFGGLLGPTFNYVFEKQLTDLQNGDRFYYLARTPGMNLRSQLEGNSFAELVMRNTSPYTHTLKADPFATADCKFENANLTSPAIQPTIVDGVPSNLNEIFGTGSVNDDPASECNENLLLLRQSDGTIQYRTTNSVDPLGINGQAVYNGTDFADDFFGGNDNDTFWGGLGDDIINGGGGDDVVLGGDDDDIITDTAGADFLKGGPGNDAIDGGIGDDIIIAGDGKDFTNGGGNINETFLGEGDDFAIAGQSTDAVFGDSGDDWEEGGDQPDLLIGDSSSLFFDDHNLPGHDILIGQGGDDDYDMEGGDDIGVAGPGVEKNAGGAGWDWLIGLGDPQSQDMDLDLTLVGVPLPINAVRDRFNEVEALSGWKFNDTLRGDSIVPSAIGGGGFIGCNALDADGVARIAGLDALVPADIRTEDSAPIAAAAVTLYCGLEGSVWGKGNILLGGDGSDILEGRGGDDILDGDKYMNVRLSIRDGADDANGVDTVTGGLGTEIGSTGLMENVAASGSFGIGANGMTLQQAVFAGKVNPGNIVAVRELLTPAVVPADCTAATPLNCDRALFSGPEVDYTIVLNDNGSVTVTDNGGATADDGVDTLWNMEQLIFCDVPNPLANGDCLTPATEPVSITPVAGVTGSLDFGSRLVNTSTTQSVTVRNTGISPLTVSDISLTGTDAANFLISGGTCANAILTRGGATCSISVTFTPSTSGAMSASVVIAHNPQGSQSIIPASGTGISTPVASVSANTLVFGNQDTGTTSAASTVVLSNTGGAPLTINSIVLAGADFSRIIAPDSDCGGALAAGSTCNISVIFAPQGAGAKTGSITINDNSNGVASSQIVTLSGTGTAPVASVSANTLAFGNQDTGTTSATSTVVLSNTGDATLTINSIVLAGADFSRITAPEPSCGGVLAAGSACNINVSFTPASAGAKTGSITINDNSNGVASNQIVSLSGTGVDVSLPIPIAEVTPTALDFGNVLIGGTTLDQSVTLRNTGTGAMSITGVTVSTGAGFTRVTGGCTTTLAAGSSCLITVRFSPTNALRGGAKTGLLTISDNSGNVASQQTVTLSGFGAVDAVNDVRTVLAGTGAAAQVINSQNVRANDVTNNVASVVSIDSSSKTNGGAAATVAVTGANLNILTWTLTPPATATTGALRQASKRGTYTVTYRLTNGTATDTATYTLTVN